MTVDAAIVIANCLKNRPEMPDINAVGPNTAHNVSAMAMMAVETSFIVRCAASFGDMPSAMFRSTFSTTTIASSTTIPTARTSPNNDRLLIDAPNSERMVNVPTSDTGIATTGMIVARQFCRNRYTTPTTSRMAMPMVFATSCDRLGNEGSRVVNLDVVDAGREALLQLSHFGPHVMLDLHHVRIGRGNDEPRRGRVPVGISLGAIVHRAEFDTADIANACHASLRIGLDHDVAKLFGRR